MNDLRLDWGLELEDGLNAIEMLPSGSKRTISRVADLRTLHSEPAAGGARPTVCHRLRECLQCGAFAADACGVDRRRIAALRKSRLFLPGRAGVASFCRTVADDLRSNREMSGSKAFAASFLAVLKL